MDDRRRCDNECVSEKRKEPAVARRLFASSIDEKD
jgi:hypothetical protein